MALVARRCRPRCRGHRRAGFVGRSHPPAPRRARDREHGASLWLFSLVLHTLDVGVAYAVFAGLGIAVTATVGILWRAEAVSPLKLTALGLICLGVVLLPIADRTLQTTTDKHAAQPTLSSAQRKIHTLAMQTFSGDATGQPLARQRRPTSVDR